MRGFSISRTVRSDGVSSSLPVPPVKSPQLADGSTAPPPEDDVLQALADMATPLGDFLKGMVVSMMHFRDELERVKRELGVQRRRTFGALSLSLRMLGGDRELIDRYYGRLKKLLARARMRRKQRLCAAALGSSENGLRRVYLHKTVKWTQRAVAAARRMVKFNSQAEALLGLTTRGLTAVYFRKLRRFAFQRNELEMSGVRNHRLVTTMLGSSSDGLRRVYLQKIANFVGRCNVVHRRNRLAAAILGSSSEGLRRVYHRRVVAWTQKRIEHAHTMEVRQRALDVMGRTSTDALRRLYLQKAARVGRKAEQAARRVRLAGALVATSSDGLRREYLRKAALFGSRAYNRSSLMSTRLRVLDALSLRSSRALLMRVWQRLRVSAEVACKQRIEREKRLLRLRRAQDMAGTVLGATRSGLCRVYLQKIRKHVARTSVSGRLELRTATQKRRAAWNRWRAFSKRIQLRGLETQMEKNMRTLSNTNSVLNKLVDRLISIDEQLDLLDKEKVSRKELAGITEGDEQRDDSHDQFSGTHQTLRTIDFDRPEEGTEEADERSGQKAAVRSARHSGVSMRSAVSEGASLKAGNVSSFGAGGSQYASAHSVKVGGSEQVGSAHSVGVSASLQKRYESLLGIRESARQDARRDVQKAEAEGPFPEAPLPSSRRQLTEPAGTFVSSAAGSFRTRHDGEEARSPAAVSAGAGSPATGSPLIVDSARALRDSSVGRRGREEGVYILGRAGYPPSPAPASYGRADEFLRMEHKDMSPRRKPRGITEVDFRSASPASGGTMPSEGDWRQRGESVAETLQRARQRREMTDLPPSPSRRPDHRWRIT